MGARLTTWGIGLGALCLGGMASAGVGPGDAHQPALISQRPPLTSERLTLEGTDPQGVEQAERVAHRWQRGLPPRGPRGVYPQLLDLDQVARDRIQLSVARSAEADEAKLDACMQGALDRGEPLPQQTILSVRLEADGRARPTALRMEGPHSTGLQDCFWRVAAPWRWDDLPPVELDLEAVLKIARRPRGGARPSAPDALPEAPPVDRSQGLVDLAIPAEALGPHAEDWGPLIEAWTADLKGCFHHAWETADYICEGPLAVELRVGVDGSVFPLGDPSWVEETLPGDGTSADPAPINQVSPKKKEGAGEVVSETPLPPLTPRCPAPVARCVTDSLTIWRLPGDGELWRLPLRAMVHPPHRLDEAPPPAAWDVPAPLEREAATPALPPEDQAPDP